MPESYAEDVLPHCLFGPFRYRQRYDKTDANFVAAIYLVAAFLAQMNGYRPIF